MSRRARAAKTTNPPRIPLDGELWEVIERRWKAREYRTREGAIALAEHVFHVHGKPMPTSTFNAWFRYDVASMDDKLEALRKARVYAAERVKISQNLAAFPASADTQTGTRDQKPASFLGNLVAVQGFEPRTQRI